MKAVKAANEIHTYIFDYHAVNDKHCGVGCSYIVCNKCGLKSPQFTRAFDRASDIDATTFWNGRFDNVG